MYGVVSRDEKIRQTDSVCYAIHAVYGQCAFSSLH